MTEILTPDQHVRVLEEPTYDLERLVVACDDLLAVRPFGTSARGTDRLRSICLTHRRGAADPWTDGNNSQFDRTTRERVYEESDFSEFNRDLDGTYFREVYDSLPFTCGRMRLMLLPSLTVYKMHKDSARRAHIAVRTNVDTRLVFRDGFSHHVPADGRLHILNTTVPHSAYNAGLDDRLQLTMSVVDV